MSLIDNHQQQRCHLVKSCWGTTLTSLEDQGLLWQMCWKAEFLRQTHIGSRRRLVSSCQSHILTLCKTLCHTLPPHSPPCCFRRKHIHTGAHTTRVASKHHTAAARSTCSQFWWHNKTEKKQEQKVQMQKLSSFFFEVVMYKHNRQSLASHDNTQSWKDLWSSQRPLVLTCLLAFSSKGFLKKNEKEQYLSSSIQNKHRRLNFEEPWSHTNGCTCTVCSLNQPAIKLQAALRH